MSKVSIEGNASGTGTLTIAAPNTNTNYTLTLPESTGTAVVSGTTPSLNGIAFPATQVASADANTLDDYEEGTWTGTIKGLTTDPTTPVTSTGTYTKIGRQVFARISFSSFNTTGASGNFFVSGLPFSTAQAVATGNIIAYNFLTYAGGQNVSPYVSGTSIFAYYMSSNGIWAASTHNAGSNRFLDISVTYNV